MHQYTDLIFLQVFEKILGVSYRLLSSPIILCRKPMETIHANLTQPIRVQVKPFFCNGRFADVRTFLHVFMRTVKGFER